MGIRSGGRSSYTLSLVRFLLSSTIAGHAPELRGCHVRFGYEGESLLGGIKGNMPVYDDACVGFAGLDGSAAFHTVKHFVLVDVGFIPPRF